MFNSQQINDHQHMQLSQAPTAPNASQSQHKHVIQRFLDKRDRGLGPKTMVIGHRGGYISGPENSMKCFKAALAANLDGIEFDVSTLYSRGDAALLLVSYTRIKPETVF